MGCAGSPGVDLTDDLARDLGAAAAAWAGPGASVLIGRDTRESGAGLEDALVAGHPLGRRAGVARRA